MTIERFEDLMVIACGLGCILLAIAIVAAYYYTGAF